MKGKLVVIAAGLAVMLAAPSAAVAGDTRYDAVVFTICANI